VLDLPYRFGGVVLVDRELLTAASSFGLWINVWTIDDEDMMERLVELGVGGIMTDRPDRLRAVLDRHLHR
jgi:glycerophosphoryl diester phosphodiesterase